MLSHTWWLSAHSRKLFLAIFLILEDMVARNIILYIYTLTNANPLQDLTHLVNASRLFADLCLNFAQRHLTLIVWIQNGVEQNLGKNFVCKIVTFFASLLRSNLPYRYSNTYCTALSLGSILALKFRSHTNQTKQKLTRKKGHFQHLSMHLSHIHFHTINSIVNS